MLKLHYILLIFCAVNLVKSNPVYQRQARPSCPVHGQPSFHQQPPNPQHQPYPPLNHGHQPQCGRPINFNPQAAPRPAYHQSTVQHKHPSKPCQQSTAVYQQPSEVHHQQSSGCQRPNNQASAINNLGLPLNHDLGQYLVERLFSNPVFREILNNNQPGTVPLENKQPNVVNNYFIVPKDLFLNNTECIQELQKPNNVKGRRRLNDANRAKNIIRNKSEKYSRTEAVDMPPEIRVVKNNNQFIYPEEYNYNEEHRERPAKAIKSKATHNASGATLNNNSTLKNNKTKMTNTKNRNSELTAPRKTKSNESKISFLSDEYIFNDFKRKFPHIPDETAKNMIKQMKEQVRKQYSNYMDNNQTPVQYIVRRKPHSENNQRNSTKARKQSKNTASVNNSTVTSQNETIRNITETPLQKVYSSTENTMENLKESIASTEASKLDTTTEGLKNYKPETSDNTTPLTINGHYNTRLPELGTEDSMPNIDENDLIGETDFPDYYPDFNFDNHAYHIEALEEYANDNIQRDERKVDEHHETMLNAETRPNINRRMGKKVRRPIIENKGNRNGEQYKQTKLVPEENVLVVATYANEPNSEGEEIVFQIPPGLESPDFETIQLVAINDDADYESDKYPKEHYEKFSTYSEIKNGDYFNPVNEIKKVKVTKPRDLGNSDIETVFATSRVVNYANPNDLAFQETVTVKNSVLFAGDMASNGATTFVVAKSYDDS